MTLGRYHFEWHQEEAFQSYWVYCVLLGISKILEGHSLLFTKDIGRAFSALLIQKRKKNASRHVLKLLYTHHWSCHCKKQFFRGSFSRAPVLHLADYNHKVIMAASKGQHRRECIRQFQVLHVNKDRRLGKTNCYGRRHSMTCYQALPIQVDQCKYPPPYRMLERYLGHLCLALVCLLSSTQRSTPMYA